MKRWKLAPSVSTAIARVSARPARNRSTVSVVSRRGLLKPISTLRRPLESVDLETRDPEKAAYERSDICVTPAAGVIGEAMVAMVLAQAMLEKFGGDSLLETRRNYDGYKQQVKDY